MHAAESTGPAIGAVVRTLRTRQQLSMRSLASAAGVSQPFLSKLENGLLQPSIATLYALAAALGVGPGELLPAVTSTSAPVHLSSGERGSTPSAQLLSGGPGQKLEVYLFTAEPGAADEVSFEHAGEEFVHVLAGEVVLHRAGLPDRGLVAGDSVTFDPSAPHSWAVPREAATPARYLLVSSIP